MSRAIEEIEREIAQAARWSARWRLLAEEAVEIARTMSNPDARRHMLFISEGYQLLAERAEERREKLLVRAAAAKRGPC
jgi:hypothetical protein